MVVEMNTGTEDTPVKSIHCDEGVRLVEDLRKTRQLLEQERVKNSVMGKQLKNLKNNPLNKEKASLLGRIHKCKIRLKEKKLKKTGYNSHNKYHYFELSDFLPSLEVILDEAGLATYCYFEADKGYLVVFDTETGVSHTWSTKCISSHVKENGFDVGVHMKSEQAIQTYARRTLYLQAFDIVEPNEIENDGEGEEKPKPAPKQKPKARSPVKPVKEPKTEVTAERVQEILRDSQRIFDEYMEGRTEEDKRPFTWDNARRIRKQCHNEQEFKACSQALIFKNGNEVE